MQGKSSTKFVNVPDNPPNVTAQQTRNIAGNAAEGLWSFVIGSLLGLAAALGGAAAGARSPRPYREGTYRER
jgi:hypothetical protein